MKIHRTDHPSRFRWPAWAIAKLGKVPDHVLAERLGIRMSTVAEERWRRAIPSYRDANRFEWTKERLALLGTDSDARIAAILGLATATVHRRRATLGIGAANPSKPGPTHRPPPFWTPERDALLGTDSDQKISDRLGITLQRVAYRRKKLGIAPANPTKRVDWEKIDPFLGTVPDRQLAERFGLYPAQIVYRRRRLKIPASQPERRRIVRDAAAARLVSKPNREITEISKVTAAKIRHELGIKHPPRPTAWTEKALVRLGKVPDDELARELGLLPDTVRKKRYERGIHLRPPRKRWTREELDIVRSAPDVESAARKLDRSPRASRHKRRELAGK